MKAAQQAPQLLAPSQHGALVNSTLLGRPAALLAELQRLAAGAADPHRLRTAALEMRLEALAEERRSREAAAEVATEALRRKVEDR